MVAEYGTPFYLKFGMGVDEFVVGHPQRVVDRADADAVMGVAKRKKCIRAHCLGDIAHQFCYRFLFVISIAAEVVANHQLDIAVQLCGRGLGKYARTCHESQKNKCEYFAYHCSDYFVPKAPKCGLRAGD